MCTIALKDNLFENPLLTIINASLRITGKIFCKFIVVEKLLNVSFYIHFISCSTKWYLSGSNIYFFSLYCFHGGCR